MDWTTIILSLIASCIPATFAYLTANKQSKEKINELKMSFENDLEKIRTSHANEIELMELKFSQDNKSHENDLINNLTAEVMRGNLDLSQIESLGKKVNKSSFNPANKRKRK